MGQSRPCCLLTRVGDVEAWWFGPSGLVDNGAQTLMKLLGECTTKKDVVVRYKIKAQGVGVG